MIKTLSDLMKENGIAGLRTYKIAENEMYKAANVIGYVKREDKWIIYDFDERCQMSVFNEYNSEEETINELFKIVKSFYSLGR
ncbi:MAG: hypothetical protein LIO87_06410 [Eubacterium sp.]|nr:hypothetical protein [Eubacterium sp.]MCC8173578.1 hypothetical protein [Odoribacter sp.]